MSYVPVTIVGNRAIFDMPITGNLNLPRSNLVEGSPGPYFMNVYEDLPIRPIRGGGGCRLSEGWRFVLPVTCAARTGFSLAWMFLELSYPGLSKPRVAFRVYNGFFCAQGLRGIEIGDVGNGDAEVNGRNSDQQAPSDPHAYNTKFPPASQLNLAEKCGTTYLYIHIYRGFPTIRHTFCGVPIIRIIVCWVLRFPYSRKIPYV